MAARLRAASDEYERRQLEAKSTSPGDAAMAAHFRLSGLGEEICSARGHALNLADLEQIEPTSSIVRDVELCLASNDPQPLSTGFFFLNALTLRHSVEMLPINFRKFFNRRLVELLEHPAVTVASQAINWLFLLTESPGEQRERMLRFLSSDEPALRKMALRWYGSFARPMEIDPLLAFEEDGFATEAAPGGPWCYELRDLALLTIEKQLGLSFQSDRKREAFEGSQVSWRDWSPVHTHRRAQHLKIVK